MNKTLLLIICDFLLLNLLALTRWDKVEPPPNRKPPVPEVSAARQNQDLVDMMKLSLEQEQATRNQLQQRLQFAEADSQTRAQTLTQLQTQKSQLETNLKQSQTAAQDLSQRYASATKQVADAKQQQDALTAAIKNVEAEKAQMQQTVAAKQAEIQKQQTALVDLGKQQAAAAQQAANLATTVKVVQAEKDLIRDQLEKQMQAALAAKQAELEKQQAALADLEKQRQAAAAQATQFATAAKVAETERNLLRENLTDLKKEVAVVRLEKDQLQSQTARLSEGVGQLAAKSGELAKEIRENTPINMNLMFSEFLSNRVDVSISAQQNVLLGSGDRLKDTKSVLVHDGRTVMAILHVTDTPFSLTTPLGMDRILARVARPPQALASGALTFITADPRLAVIPVDAQQALALANSELTNRLSRLLAASLTGRGASDDQFVEAAFGQVLARAASADERRAAREFLERLRGILASQTGQPAPPAGAQPPGSLPASDPAQRARENLVLALFNHTDFLTIR